MSTSGRMERPSDEVDRRQLALAREEGDAYQRALDYMAEEVADNGTKKVAGDYLVGIAQERAEGMYMPNGSGKLAWHEPDEENCHIEVSVADAADHRFIPGLDIEVTLIPEDGDEVGPFAVPFLWHPGLYHYGANVKVPGDGRYTVKVAIAPAPFARHDKKNGKRFSEPVEATFSGFAIETGQE